MFPAATRTPMWRASSRTYRGFRFRTSPSDSRSGPPSGSMTDLPMTVARAKSRWPRIVGVGCLGRLGAGIGAPAGALWLYQRRAAEAQRQAEADQQARAKEEFEPIFE